ncbi:condensation domain-containing protein [Amycolatopsis mediterranei]|uniref:condensation domain-containing protein n=1 Tax=Amycolatopsis mediterranei TaxID=33910 RepID=UPI00331DCB54
MPWDRSPAQAHRTRSSRTVRANLSTEDTARLREVARRHGLTVNTLVQGAWALLLAHSSGESDVVFGTTVSGRPDDLPGVETMIGMFINTIPTRTRIDRGERGRPAQRQRVTGQADQAGDRRLGGRDPGSRLAATAEPQDEHPHRVHFPLLLQQVDGGDGVRHVLVGHREAGRGTGFGVDVGHLVEPGHRDAAGGQPPRQVLERLVGPGRQVAVGGPRGEQHQPRPRATPPGTGDRAGHRERAGADGDLVLGEPVRLGVGRRRPGRAGRRREPEAVQQAGVVDRHHHREAPVRPGHRNAHPDQPRPGRLAHRVADRPDRPDLGDLRLPADPERVGGRRRPQPRGEQPLDLRIASRCRHVDDRRGDRRRIRSCHRHPRPPPFSYFANGITT